MINMPFIEEAPEGEKRCGSALSKFKWDKNLGISVVLAKKAGWSQCKWRTNFKKHGTKALLTLLKTLIG